MLGFSLSRTTVTEITGAYILTIKAPRPWTVKAGQYVHLQFLSTNILSCWSSYPVMISWWKEEYDRRGRVSNLRLSMLVKQEAVVSQRLRQLSQCELPTLTRGPHGNLHDFGNFGTCLMFATGIEVTSVLPHIQALIDGRQRLTVRTRRIVLMWEIEHESTLNWPTRTIDPQFANTCSSSPRVDPAISE